jgi:hypothetical protein
MFQSAQDQQVPTQEGWQRAESQIRRSPPSAFGHVPKWVADDLVTRGCAIPQPFGAREPSNLIRGQFARNGEWNWAAICSKEGKSQVVVLWGGQAACPNHLGESPDINQLVGIDSGKIGYTYRIVRVGPDEIRKDIREWGDPQAEEHVKPSPMTESNFLLERE